MRSKTKNILIPMLLLVFLAIALFVGTKSLAVNAATVGSSNYVKYKLDISGDGVVAVYVYGYSSASADTSDTTYDTFNFSPQMLEVEIEKSYTNSRAGWKWTYKGLRLSGPTSYSDSSAEDVSYQSNLVKTFSIPALSDGTYTLTVDTMMTSYPGAGSGGYTKSCSFKVDTVSPSISGASTSSIEIYKNSTFTVSASDSVSGVANLYMKSPSSSLYTAVGSSISIYSGSVNGLYTFYATDNANNTTSYYYVNFDDTAPTLSCSEVGFGTTTKNGFTVNASDNSGSVTLYYRYESGDWYSSGGSSYTVSSSAEDGKYYFYAVDKFNNRSDEVWIELGGDIVGEFIKSDSDNSVYFTWERDSWTATLDGGSYTKGSWIRSEGKHTIVLSAGVANAVYTHTIDHYYVETISEATCTHGGQIEYNCVQCGDRYMKVSEELGHYYVASTVTPTCTDGGYTTYTCTRCGDSYTDNYTPKLGHNLVSSVVAPKCTVSGYTIYSCSRCNYVYRSGSTPATGHNYKQTTYPATCTEGSYTLHECSRCGNSYRDNISQPLGHNFIEEEKPPTCTESGKIVYHCQVCDYEKEESDGSLPMGHDYSSIIVKEATCTEDGLRRSTCDKCGHTYETKVNAHGHTYEITDLQTADGFTTRTYTCRECGASYTQELGNQYEEVTNYVEWVFFATAGVWSIAIGVAIILAHKNEDKEKAKKMLINYVIGLVVIAVIVVACPYLVRGIAVLVTS